jgi:hypothetical protein
MFNVQKSKKQITIETGNAIYGWDAARGGQLTQLTIKDGEHRRTMLDPGRAAPNLTLKLPGGTVSVADYPAEFSTVYEEPGYLVFACRSQIGDAFTFEQQYEVFQESVVFCEFRLAVNPGKKVRISSADMGFDLNLARAGNLRSTSVSRDPYLKQDVTTSHVLGAIKVAQERQTPIHADQLIAMVGLDLGWDTTRCYSHRLEMIIEDNSSIGGGMLAPTSTVSEERRGRWQHQWRLCRNGRETLEAPFFYRNKWALYVGSARTEAGPKADPVRRNNVLGARICHVMYPYVYATRNWPWCSVPMRQTFYQDVQLGTKNPPLSDLDKAAKLGCNVVLIHQFWMKNGGSNGEPMADYRPHDPKWLKAFIKRAHHHGMRVLMYMRGIEQYSMYFDFFEKYLKRNFDGLYMDWATPFAMGYTKSTPKHSSVYNYFMFTRALRKRVGENGVLIGHSIVQAASSYATFDATVTGEFSVLHAGLLAAPLISASYAGIACVGAHLIAGNSPDRAAFSGPKAVGFAAGLGWANHPFMEPGKNFTQCSAFAKPLWDMINCLESDPVKMFNPAVQPDRFASWSDEGLYPLAYKDKAGNVLVTVANLGETTVTGRVELDLGKLGLKPGVTLKALRIRNAARARIEGRTIVVDDLKPYAFCGVMVSARS